MSSKCVFGNLTLLPYSPGHDSNFVYCGQYPAITNYLSSNLIDVILAIERFVAFDVLMSYSVIDNLIWRSISLNLNKARIQSLSWTQILPVSKLFHNFYLSVEKFKRLSLGLDKKIYEYSLVYDGPGYLTDHLRPVSVRNNISWYLSKTFQSIVHLFFLASDVNFAFELKYFSVFIKNIPKLTLNETEIKSLNFPNANCSVKHPICAIEVTVNSSSKLNLTLHHLTYNGQVHSMCNYGGLTSYDNINGTYIEISTICKPHNGVFKNRNIYSKTSLLLLVFYQYEEYAHVEINSIVSSTACMPISFNTFEMHKVCLWDIDDQCDSIIKKMVKESGIDILFQYTKLKYKLDTIILETNERACAILQFHYNLENNKPIADMIGYITMKFQIAHSLQTRKDIFINITGFLKGESMSKLVVDFV